MFSLNAIGFEVLRADSSWAILLLPRLRHGLVGLEQGNVVLDLVRRLEELLGLWVDPGHDH